eukprot:scaffold9897_cov68-Cylindrotheca_fusiformis.AAC.3
MSIIIGISSMSRAPRARQIQGHHAGGPLVGTKYSATSLLMLQAEATETDLVPNSGNPVSSAPTPTTSHSPSEGSSAKFRTLMSEPDVPFYNL